MPKNNPHLKNLLEGGFSSFFSLFASQISLGILSFFAVVLSTRLLGTEGYGVYGLFLSVTSLIVSFSYAWLRAGVFKFASEQYSASQSMGKIIGTGLVIGGIFFLIIALGLWASYDWVSAYAGIRGKYYLLFLIYIVELDWVTQINYLFRATGQFKRFALITPLERMFYLVLLAFVFFTMGSLRPETLIVFLLVSNLMTIGVGLKFIPKKGLFPLRFDRAVVKKIFRFSWPILLTNIILYLSNWADIILIKYYLDTTKVGIFYLAIQFANMASQLILVLNTLLAPVFIALIQEKRQETIDKFYARFFPQIVCISALAFLIVSGLLRLVVPVLFHFEFQQSLIPIQIMLISVHAWLCFMLISPYLFASEKTLMITILTFVSFMVSLPLYFIFIPSFGLEGAAWVRVAGSFTLYVLGAYFGLRNLRVKKNGLLLGAILSQAILVISVKIEDPTFWCIYTVTILALSISILRKLGMFASEDIQTLEGLKLPARILDFAKTMQHLFYQSRNVAEYFLLSMIGFLLIVQFKFELFSNAIFLLLLCMIECLLMIQLKRGPYPRLWVTPQSNHDWNKMKHISRFSSLHPSLFEYLIQDITFQANYGTLDKSLVIMDRVRNAFPFHMEEDPDFNSALGYINGSELYQRWRENPDLKVNCGTYSHLFLRLCKHFHVMARMVVMSDRQFKDNHVLCEVWNEEASSWVLFDLLYDATFECRGKKLSAVEVRRFVLKKETIEVKRGRAILDSYCTPERILAFFDQGLVTYLMYLPPQFSFFSRYLHRAYLFDESAGEHWWVNQKLLQVTILALPLLIAMFILSKI